MSTAYPNSLDNFVNPTPNDKLDSATVPHADQHANLNDAVEAMQTVLGVSPAGSHLTIKDRIINAESQISAQSTLNGLTDVTIGLVNGGDVLRYNGTQWVNYSESGLVDGGNF
jgi:hypothetical protein